MRRHLMLAVVAVVIYGALHVPLGRIPVNDGQGWDGRDYAVMLEDGWASGAVNTQLRPLIVWLAGPAYDLTGSPAVAFDIMNYVYAGLLAFLLSLLMERYGAPLSARAVVIVCIALSNALRLPAYYPVLIDLGAHVMMTLAIWTIISGPRWAATVACVAAVLSREYAPVVLVFGAIRDRRLGVPFLQIVKTYVPAVVVYVALRVVVDMRWVNEGNTVQTFVKNLYFWKDPMWAALYAYFALTSVGGLSLVLAAQPRRWWRFMREEPEWLAIVLPIAFVTGLVGIDIWRYLTALTPVAVVVFASCYREWSAGERRVLMSAIVVLTLVTQMPFQGMDLTRYFTDWFPYYAWTNSAPVDVPRGLLWPGWAWRFLIVTLSMGALTTYANRRGRAVVTTT